VYTKDNISVYRIDRCGETLFYFGNELDESNGKIRVEYSGINDGFDAYLSFENSKAILYTANGSFREDNLDTSKLELRNIRDYNFSDRPEIGLNVCFLMLSMRWEEERNNLAGSGVKVNYLIDDNDWW
jgi:hypothetical protein